MKATGSGGIQAGARALLTNRRLRWIVSLAAVVLALPALRVGFEADDYFHRVTLLNLQRFPELCIGPAKLFAFADGDPERMTRIMDLGIAPWWTLKELKISFCRPLTAFTHWVDYRLAPNLPALMHAQSLVWFFGFIFAAATLYRRIMGPTVVAGLAALLFAIDDAHATPAGWLAGRNTLLAAVFGVVALLAHDRWRRDGWKIGAFAGPAAFLASLLSGEMGVATLAYLVPYALWIDPAPWKRRLAAVAPFLIVVVVWRVTWAALGYGVYGVAAYVDPLTQPLRFARIVLETGPIMLMGQWALPPSDLYILYDTLAPGLSRLVWLAAAGFVVVAAAIMLPWLRGERVARFWACGMGLSLLPVCASTNFPMDRLLLFVGLGATGLLAQFLAAVFEHRRQLVAGIKGLPRRIPAQVLAILLVGIHLALAPASFVVRAATPAGPRSFTQQFYVNTPFDAQIEQQDLVVINAPSAGIVGMMPVLRALAGQPIPRHTRMLGPSLATMEVSRPDDRTLLLRPEGGWMAWAYDQLVRGSDYPLALHERIELTGLSVEVTALTSDGRPAEAVFRFNVPLEDPSLRWLQWRDKHFVPFMPPAVGQTVRLPATTPALR